MKIAVAGASLACALAFIACNSSTSSDPATTERSALNPPTSLVSLTGDGKLTLRFSGANTETSFQGYDVFIVANKTVKTIAGSTTLYPSNAQIDPTTNPDSASIPRCKDNTSVFEAFGFPASTATCEGGSTGGTSDATSGSSLRLDDTSNTTSQDPAPTNLAVCDENTTDKSVSLKLSKPILGPETCTISKLADGTALANGTTYSIFVATVAGDKKNKLSWTSNFIQDTPAMPLYSNSISLGSNNVYLFGAANLTASGFTKYDSTVITSSKTCDQYAVSGNSLVCKVNQLNSVLTTTTDDGLFFGRQLVTDPSPDYPARVFLSVPTNGALKILPRGPRLTLDSAGVNANTATPGVDDDKAIATTTTYDGAGTLYPIYGYQVFDILVTTGTASAPVHHYGKVIIGKLSVTGTESAATSKVNVPVTIIMQPEAESTDYFTGM